MAEGGNDLFKLNGKHFHIAVDFFSRFIELIELRSETADCVITALQNIFARHGIPAVVCSDKRPCYAADNFRQFAATYAFLHTTSSPHYAKRNGKAERAVQIANNLLRKASDPYLALLAYRATPTQMGYSPAQLLMGRQLRTMFPLPGSALKPITPCWYSVAEKDAFAKERKTSDYNKRHRVQTIPTRQEGEDVWVPNIKSRAKIVETHPNPLIYTAK